MDDLAIIVLSKSRTLAQEKLQGLVNKAYKWASSIGMKFSPGKTVCMHFHQKGSLQPEPEIYLGNDQITVAKQVKFLGVTFDRTLMFKQHMEITRIKCLKALNLLKVIAKDGTGINRQRKLMAYRALIRSKLDFGSQIYASGSKQENRRLEAIQTQCLRICSGAYRTSPKERLQVMCRELPISLRQISLEMKYYLRALSVKGNSALKNLEINKYDILLERRHPRNATFKARMAKHLKRANIDIKNIMRQEHCFSPFLYERTPPSRRQIPTVDMSLAVYSKHNTPNTVFKNVFADTCSKFTDALFVYTDGSKNSTAASCGFFMQGSSIGFRTSNDASIFTAEALAIVKAIEFARLIAYGRDIVICSDSMSVLQTLTDLHCKSPISRYIQELSMKETSSCLYFMWVPGHVGIHGNEQADKVARLALAEPVESSPKIYYKDLYAKISRYIHKIWMDSWSVPTKEINEIVNRMRFADNSGVTPKNEKVITRILLGHSHLTHSYLLYKKGKPECEHCACFLTLPHVLYNCPLYSVERILHGISTETVYTKPGNLVNFLVSTNLIERL